MMYILKIVMLGKADIDIITYVVTMEWEMQFSLTAMLCGSLNLNYSD